MNKEEMERMLRRSGQAKLDEFEQAGQEINAERPLRGKILDLSNNPNLSITEESRRRIALFEEQNEHRLGALAAEEVDERSIEGMRVDEHTKYSAMPLAQMVACGTMALLLLGGQFWVESLPAELGSSFYSAKPWLRIVMIFSGALFAFMAWPRLRVKGIEDKELEERRRAAEAFRRRMRR